jgi:hypothetical protein
LLPSGKSREALKDAEDVLSVQEGLYSMLQLTSHMAETAAVDSSQFFELIEDPLLNLLVPVVIQVVLMIVSKIIIQVLSEVLGLILAELLPQPFAEALWPGMDASGVSLANVMPESADTRSILATTESMTTTTSTTTVKEVPALLELPKTSLHAYVARPSQKESAPARHDRAVKVPHSKPARRGTEAQQPLQPLHHSGTPFDSGRGRKPPEPAQSQQPLIPTESEQRLAGLDHDTTTGGFPSWWFTPDSPEANAAAAAAALSPAMTAANAGRSDGATPAAGPQLPLTREVVEAALAPHLHRRPSSSVTQGPLARATAHAAAGDAAVSATTAATASFLELDALFVGPCDGAHSRKACEAAGTVKSGRGRPQVQYGQVGA